MKHVVSSCLAAILATSIAGAAAQTYPSKPIRIVVPFAAGGFSDLYARIIAAKLQEAWGQAAVVDNRPGAGGNIGTDIVAKSAPDGHTLLMGGIGTHAINPAVYRKLPYDSVRDFIPVAFVVDSEGLLALHPSVPAASVKEIVALAKKRAGALTYGSAGSGTTSHLAAELFKSMAKVDIIHVPYKSNAAAVSELVGGQISMVIAPLSIALPFVKDNRLRGIASMGAQRSAATPSIPTLAESGLPGFEVNNWAGMFAPAGTPAAVISRLNAEIVRIMQLPEVKARLPGEGLRFMPASPEQFAEFVRREYAKWGAVVRAAGAYAD